MRPLAGLATVSLVSLSISPEAAELIRARSQSVHLELPATIVTACCAQSFQERPTVRFGPPPERERGIFVAQSIGDVTVFVPPAVDRHHRDLRIVVSSFLGIRRLFVEGWWPV